MSTADQPLTPAQAESFVAVSEPWFSCDECFDQMEGLVDALIQSGRGPDEAFRLHLRRCPACHEEVETLISLAAGDHGLNPDDVLARFRRHLGPVEPDRPVPKRLRAGWFRRR